MNFIYWQHLCRAMVRHAAYPVALKTCPALMFGVRWA